jgi:hypothetical protein
MRWGAAILAAMAVAMLVGCGGTPEGSEAVNNGARPSPTGQTAVVDRAVRTRNEGAEVQCGRRTIPDESGVSTWECNVRLKKRPGAEALVEVISGDGLPYGRIGGCRSNPAGPNICPLIH